MIRLLKFLFTGTWHEHKWETIGRGTLHQGRSLVGQRYTLRCTQCGDVKCKDML